MYNADFFAEGQVFSNEDRTIAITHIFRIDGEVFFSGVWNDGTTIDEKSVEILQDCQCLHSKSRPFLDAMMDLRKQHLIDEEDRRNIIQHFGGINVFCEESGITKGTLYGWVRTGKASARTLAKLETLLNKGGFSL